MENVKEVGQNLLDHVVEILGGEYFEGVKVDSISIEVITSEPNGEKGSLKLDLALRDH